MGVDAATGAALEHYPSPVAFTLEAEQTPGAKPQVGPRRGKKPKALAFKPDAEAAPAATPAAAQPSRS